MTKRMLVVAGLGMLMGWAAAGAQAPAGAPAGANGICKDGTYSTAASKSGACRGHNGVQTWYSAATATATKGASGAAAPATMPTPKPTATASAMPAPKAATSAPAAMPAPTPSTTVAPAAAKSKAGPAANAAAKTQAPGGGPGLVWLNTESNVYHCNGDTYYGKTKAGQYMSEADAKAKGAHGERGKVCTGK